MTLAALFLLPLGAALWAYRTPSDRLRRALLPATGALHLALVSSILLGFSSPGSGWFYLDPVGKLVLSLISLLFFACSLYAPAYLEIRHLWHTKVFCGCTLTLLAFLSLSTFSQQLGCMWVALEITTLTAAPLIYFNHNARSVEAAWKYLLVCSVGIALGLLGIFFLAYATLANGGGVSLLVEDLTRSAGSLSKPWLHVAFATLVVGFGTKMGLAPMHTWKPDAYGEAPGVVGALLAGGVTSCAFLALLRFTRVLHAAGEGAYADRVLLVFGLLSMATAAVFMTRHKDFQRMLAYSSVEHMGILVLGVGLGGVGVFGAFLHLVNNALTKGVLFLTAGNIHRAFGSRSTDEVSGALRRLPFSGWLFLTGFIAVIGTPLFGPFVSEFTILRATFEGGRPLVGALFLLFLMIVFLGMGRTVLDVCQGEPSAAASKTPFRDTLWLTAPSAVLFGLVLWLGLHIPSPVMDLLREAVAYWKGPA